MPPARRRSALPTWLAVLGGTLIALGILGVWAQRTLGDPDTFAALAGDLLEAPEVRTQLAIVIVDPALEDATPEVRAQRAVIVTTTAAVLGNERLVAVFEDVLRRAATRLVDGRGALRLELDDALEVIAEEAEAISPEVAAELAAVDAPEPEVISAARAEALRGFIAVERAISLVLLTIGAALTIAAVARGGGRTLLPFGATLAGACLLLFAALLAGRSLLLTGISPAERAEAARTAWDVVVGDLRIALLIGAAAGGIAVIAGGVLGRRRA
jgi:hypothetical protein